MSTRLALKQRYVTRNKKFDSAISQVPLLPYDIAHGCASHYFLCIAVTLTMSRFSSDRAASSLRLAAGCHSFPCSSINRTSFRLAVIRLGGKVAVLCIVDFQVAALVRDIFSVASTTLRFLLHFVAGCFSLVDWQSILCSLRTLPLPNTHTTMGFAEYVGFRLSASALM